MNNYIVANTASGRILSTVEGADDLNPEFAECEVSNTDLHICYSVNATPNYVFTKYWDDENHTVVDKTEMNITFSHPHTEKDFFSEKTIPGITDPETNLPVTIGRAMAGPGDWANDEIDVAPSYLRFNDFDEIIVSSNTVVTISNIPTDTDTRITLNGVEVTPSTTIEVLGSMTVVEIDSPKYFIKTVEIREE